ncbi:MAG: 2-hydroxyacyl-CoA dehydratase subunit D [Anaerovoracaceae bacterium]
MSEQTNAMVQALVEAGKTPKKTIAQSMKTTGKKAFGCFPIYVPEEIIYASGMLPVGVWGGQTTFKNVDKYIQSFCCSIMKANMELGMQGAYDFLEGVAIPTFCDTMKAILANWPMAVPTCKAIPLVYPQNRESSGSFDFMVAQFRGFQKEIEKVVGHEITDAELEDAFAVYEEYRGALREFTELVNDYPASLNPKNRHMIIKAAWFMDKKEYTKQLKELMEALKAEPKETVQGPKVVITGLIAEPESFLDIFTDFGYTFVADDLAQESRQFRVPARAEGSAIERMANRYIDLRGCTFFFEQNKSRGQMLIDMVKKYHADGVIVCMLKFCDPDEFDYPVIKKELEDAGIQTLYVEIEQQMDTVEQLRTRLQSFAEIIG